MTVIDLGPVLTSEEAGHEVYEAVVTTGDIWKLFKDGDLQITNVRPDHEITGYDEQGDPVYAKTSETAKKWTRELLADDAILGNLAWNIDPDTVGYSVENGHMVIQHGQITTDIDSATRHRAIVSAMRHDYMRSDRRVSVRVYALRKRNDHPEMGINDLSVEKVFSRMQNWGHSVVQSTTKWYAQEEWHDRVARAFCEGSTHLTDNVILNSNQVMTQAKELTSFNTLSEALRQTWRDKPESADAEREIARFLIDFYDKAAKVRPELSNGFSSSERKASRESNWMSRQIIFYGLFAVAFRLWREGTIGPHGLSVLDVLDRKVTLKTVGLRHNVGATVDFFDFDNPLWEERDMVSLRNRQRTGMKYFKPHGDSPARVNMREIVLDLCGFAV